MRAVRSPLGHDERSAIGAALVRTRRRLLTSGGGRRAGRGGRRRRRRDSGGELGTGRPEAAAREELGQDLRDVLGIGVLQRQDLELVQRHVDVHQLQDVQEPPDIRRGVGDHQEVGVARGADRALRRHERPQQVQHVGRAGELQRDELGDHLVARHTGVELGADDGPRRCLDRALLGDDPPHVAGLHGGEAVDVEDREEDGEDVVHRNAPGGLDGHLLAPRPRSQDVVEDQQFARRLQDDLDVGIVEVEDDEPARRLGRGLTGGGRLGLADADHRLTAAFGRRAAIRRRARDGLRALVVAGRRCRGRCGNDDDRPRRRRGGLDGGRRGRLGLLRRRRSRRRGSRVLGLHRHLVVRGGRRLRRLGGRAGAERQHQQRLTRMRSPCGNRIWANATDPMTAAPEALGGATVEELGGARALRVAPPEDCPHAPGVARLAHRAEPPGPARVVEAWSGLGA